MLAGWDDVGPFSIALIVLSLFALLFLIRRSPLKILSRLLRPLWRPIAALLLGLARVLGIPRAVGRRPLQGTAGHSALGALAHWFFGQSLIDAALEEATAPNFDPKKLKKKGGFLFRYIHPESGYIAFSGTLTDEEVSTAYDHSGSFFDRGLGSFGQHGSFYEEIDGLHIIEMFKASDTPFFYYLNEVRRQTNANIKRLTALVSFVISASVLLHMFRGEVASFLAAQKLPTDYLDLWIAVPGLGLLWFLGFLYGTNQEHGGRDLNDFINRYFAQLGQQHRYASEQCRSVFQKYTKKEEAEEKAAIWFITLEWTSFRVFFMELFAKNCLYQIKRNSGAYVFYVPLAFAGAIYVVLALTCTGCTLWQGSWFHYVWLAVLLGYACLIFSGAARRFLDAVAPDEWPGFKEQAYVKTVGGVIRLYVGEITFQRRRSQFQPDA